MSAPATLRYADAVRSLTRLALMGNAPPDELLKAALVAIMIELDPEDRVLGVDLKIRTKAHVEGLDVVITPEDKAAAIVDKTLEAVGARRVT